MLLQRVLTAAVLLPLAVLAIWFLPSSVLALLFGALAVLGAYEWAALSRYAGRARINYCVAVAALALLVVFALPEAAQVALWGLSAIWWCVALVWIVRYPRGFSAGRPSRGLRAAIGLLVLVSTVSALAVLHARDHGPWWVLATFVLVWGADIGAYFSGRAFGRHKLAPRVSPGKTWEGLAGGFAAAMIGAAIMALFVFPAGERPWFVWMSLCALLALVSVVGDLSESLLKRHVGLKDSGGLLPGHGGVLDRVDSVLAVAPLMALGVFGLSL